MIEHLKIITGSRKDVQSKAQEYLTEHPNAQILGTSITFKPGQVIEPPAPKEIKKPAAKAKDPTDESAAEKAPEPIDATLQAITYGPPEEVICLTLGRVF